MDPYTSIKSTHHQVTKSVEEDMVSSQAGAIGERGNPAHKPLASSAFKIQVTGTAFKIRDAAKQLHWHGFNESCPSSSSSCSSSNSSAASSSCTNVCTTSNVLHVSHLAPSTAVWASDERALLECGADARRRDTQGFDAIMYASAAGHRAMAELQDTPSRLNAPPPPELRPALDLQRDFCELEIPPAAAHDIADVQQCPALSPLPPSRSDRTLPTFVAALPTSLPRASETLHVFTPQINQGDQGRDRAPTPMASNFKLQEDIEFHLGRVGAYRMSPATSTSGSCMTKMQMQRWQRHIAETFSSNFEL